jgi:hypothetical protein
MTCKSAAIPWLVALGLALTVTGTAMATTMAAWVPAVNLSNLPGRSFQAILARDPNSGDLWAVWTEDGLPGRGGYEEILGRRWVRALQRWLPVENLSQSEPWQRDKGAIVTFDQDGQGLLIWTRTYARSGGAPADGHDLLWRSWGGASWSGEAVLFHGDAYLPSIYTLIPVPTVEGTLLFVVWDTGYRTATYRQGTWSEFTPWDYDSLRVELAEVLVDEEGQLHAVALGPNSLSWGANAAFHDAYYVTHDGARWSEPLNLSSIDGVAHDVGLALDGQDRLHFFWSDDDSPYSEESLVSTIWERVLADGAWTPNHPILAFDARRAVSGFSVTASVTGTLYLAWSEGIKVGGGHGDLDIYYRTGDGQSWAPPTEIYASSSGSRFPVLAVGDPEVALLWQEIVCPEPPALCEHEVFFSRQEMPPPILYWAYLPAVGKQGSWPP